MGMIDDKELNKLKRRIIRKSIIGAVVSISSFVLCFVFFGWKLALIFFLYEFGQNIWKSIHDIKHKVGM